MNSNQESDSKEIETSPEIGGPDTADQSDQNDTAKAPKTRNSNRNIILLLLLILVLLLASSGGLGFWLFTQFQHRFNAQNDKITELRLLLAGKGSQQQLDRLTHQYAQLSAQQADQTQALQSLNQTMRQSQTIILRNQRGWVIAEVEYLMRIARYRLNLLNDPEGAEDALSQADHRLAQLGDMTLIPVRQALIAEIQSLRDFQRPDKIGILLQINQVMSKIMLPTPLGNALIIHADTQPSVAPSTDHPNSFHALLDTIWHSISEHISIRHYPQQINELAEINTQAHATQSIYLDLLNARSAVLANDNAAYHQSIEGVIRLLRSSRSDATRKHGLEQTLTQLNAIDLSPPLPVIGHALILLKKIGTQLHASTEKAKQP